MRNRRERQNSDRPGGRRGSGSKKSGPGPAPIPAPTGDTQDRAGRGNEKETGGRGHTGIVKCSSNLGQGPLSVCGTGKSEG